MEQQTRYLHVYLVIYLMVSALVFAIYAAAYLNVYRHDPWMTPRFTPEMILLHGVRDALSWVPGLGLLFGLPLLADSIARKKWHLCAGLAFFAASALLMA